MERIRLISTKIGVFGFEEEEEGAIQIDDTVYDGDEELERHDRMFNTKEAGDE